MAPNRQRRRAQNRTRKRAAATKAKMPPPPLLPSWRTLLESTYFWGALACAVGLVSTVIPESARWAVLLLAWIFSVMAAFAAAAHARRQTIKWMIRSGGSIASGALLLALYISVIRPTWRDERLPGFSFVTAIQIQDARKYSDKYVFQYADKEGAIVSLYLSASDVFHFSIKDIRGETKNIDIPSGQEGIPLFQWISLLLEAGTASNYSVMRVSVNGRIVREERFSFHLELGSRDWISGSIGALPDGSSGASFMTTEFGTPSSTLDHQAALKLDKDIRDSNNIKDNPAWWWPW